MMLKDIVIILLLVLILIVISVSGSCDNDCSGHGICNEYGVCDCYSGWGIGLSIDGGDCSQRICPFEIAWVDSPDRIGNHHKYVECSAKGICNRDTSECECFPGYSGKACSRTTCPNRCSGHGQCIYLDKEPFKTVIGDYYNYNYGVRYAITEGTVAIKSYNSTITATPSFVSTLITNNKIAIGNDIYFIRDVFPTSFTVSVTIGGPKMSSDTSASFRISFKQSSSYSLLSLPPTNLRSFPITGGANGLFTSAIVHGLNVGDIIYFDGITVEAAASGYNNYLYSIATVPSAYTFTLAQTKTFGTTTLKLSGSLVGIAQSLSQPPIGSPVLNVVFLASSIVATGVFDVVDPVIAAHTKYIDKSYWDAKKTRGCLCDALWGEVDCSKRMCGYSSDVMDQRKNTGIVGKNHIQLITLKGASKWNDFLIADGTKGETIALTFKSKLNETFTTLPIVLPTMRCSSTTTGNLCIRAATTSVPTDAVALNRGIRNFELDVEWALKKLPNSVVDNVKVKVTKPVDTTSYTPANGVYSGLKLSSDGITLFDDTINFDTPVLQFSVEFTGNNVQGTQHYLTVEAAKCLDGCSPLISGVTLSEDGMGLTVVTQPTMSQGVDNDMESDFNSYECGRRGKCDYSSGLCKCFNGYSGPTCNVITALV